MQYVLRYPDKVLQLALEHLHVTALAIAIATLIAVPVGILISRYRWLYGPVVGVAGALYTIPSLALLTMLIPIVGLGLKNVTIALVLYSQAVLIRNTYTGITSIDPAMLEAATAMGMNRWQVLLRVELPLALPVVVAGIRIATVAAIGITAIATLVNAGGLGTLIYRGVLQYDTQRIVGGTVVSGLLAVLADQALKLVQRGLDRGRTVS